MERKMRGAHGISGIDLVLDSAWGSAVELSVEGGTGSCSSSCVTFFTFLRH